MSVGWSDTFQQNSNALSYLSELTHYIIFPDGRTRHSLLILGSNCEKRTKSLYRCRLHPPATTPAHSPTPTFQSTHRHTLTPSSLPPFQQLPSLSPLPSLPFIFILSLLSLPFDLSFHFSSPLFRYCLPFLALSLHFVFFYGYFFPSIHFPSFSFPSSPFLLMQSLPPFPSVPLLYFCYTFTSFLSFPFHSIPFLSYASLFFLSLFIILLFYPFSSLFFPRRQCPPSNISPSSLPFSSFPFSRSNFPFSPVLPSSLLSLPYFPLLMLPNIFITHPLCLLFILLSCISRSTTPCKSVLPYTVSSLPLSPLPLSLPSIPLSVLLPSLPPSFNPYLVLVRGFESI